MKIKDNCQASSSDFWYDLNEGYLDPNEILENTEDARRVIAAIAVVKEFEESCDEQIDGFVQ